MSKRFLYVLRERPAGFATTLALFAREHQSDYRLYVVGTDGTQLTREVTRFLAPEIDGVEIPPSGLSVPLRDPPDGKGAAFILLPNSDDVRLPQRRVYPAGLEDVVRSTGRRRERLFTSYLVDGESLAATRRSAGGE